MQEFSVKYVFWESQRDGFRMSMSDRDMRRGEYAFWLRRKESVRTVTEK